MNEKYLNYFKDFIESKEVATWKVFWKENEKEFEKTLSRTEFLKLKFEKINFGEKLLKDNNIEFTWTQKGRQQKVWAIYHDSVCGENGKPLMSFQRKAFSGAFGDYLDNKIHESASKAKKYINKILKEKDSVKKSELLNEAEFDAESFYEEGYVDFAIVILKIISEITTDDDLLFPAINSAKLKLSRLNLVD